MASLIRRLIMAAILTSSTLAIAGLASATTLTVSNTADSGAGSLRAAILAASSGDTINFSVSGTITLGSTLPAIAINLSIDGSGQAITVDGASAHQILIVNSGATVTVQNLTIAHGVSSFGGGIFNSGTLTINNCTFSANGGSANGGGIYNTDGATLTITNSTFSGNDSGDGGGIDNFDGTLTVTNSTFSGNTTGNFGGGILNNALGTVAVTNCTFADNNGPPSAGAIANFGNATLKGTVLAASTGGNCSFTITDAGHNISDDGSCGFSGTSINNSTTLNLDPAGLQNNGGPTETIALQPDSQAVDFIPIADCTDQSSPTPQPLTTDQRGFPRPDPGNLNFCDAGAFELTTTPFGVSSTKLQIVRSTTPADDQINLAMTFTEFGFPTCDSATDAFNGFFVTFQAGSCAEPTEAISFFLHPWTVHTVGNETYGTTFSSFPPGSLSARMVQLPTPAAPACGQWNLNLEIAGTSNALLGNGPFSLLLTNGDGGEQCFDLTNVIVGSPVDPPRKVRRAVRR